ncbi:MAG TPA: adenylate kinase, partial [Candidatus Didemnitutus sp.]|nr:adenylate kinase [Candidatus Didemnitutus sp.]
GAPGVGKGTQAVILAEKLGVAHLSTGDAFRAAIKNQTPVGVLAKEFVDAGKLVPDEIVARIVEEAMEGATFSKGCILDGFPRTRTQADALDTMLAAKGLHIDSVVNLNVDDSTIINRLLQRGRADDSEEIIRHRLDIYNHETAPLLKFYSDMGLLTSVDGIGNVEFVNERILAAIAPSGVKAHPVPDTTSGQV